MNNKQRLYCAATGYKYMTNWDGVINHEYSKCKNTKECIDVLESYAKNYLKINLDRDEVTQVYIAIEEYGELPTKELYESLTVGD